MNLKDAEDKIRSLYTSSSFDELSEFILYISKEPNIDIRFFLPLFREIINICPDLHVIKSIIHGVTCWWGINDDVIVNKAIEIASDSSIRDFFREYAISGLGSVYTSTKNKKILTLLVNILNNSEESTTIIIFAFESCLRIIGLETREIQQRISNAKSGGHKRYLEKNMIVFEKEFKEIYRIIK